jgi:hypothetical protein
MTAVAALLAWHQATRIDRQVDHENSSRQSEPSLELALGALVSAIAAAMVLQMMVLQRVVH